MKKNTNRNQNTNTNKGDKSMKTIKGQIGFVEVRFLSDQRVELTMAHPKLMVRERTCHLVGDAEKIQGWISMYTGLENRQVIRAYESLR